jgi:hypothetical protein
LSDRVARLVNWQARERRRRRQGGALYLSVAKLARPGELGGGREPVCAWGERARE